MDQFREKVERIVRQVVAEVLSAEGDQALAVVRSVPGARVPMVAANWKMNMLTEQVRDYALRFDPKPTCGVEVVLCPPAVLLPVLVAAMGDGLGVRFGAQNLYPLEKGAFTGEHSPQMIRDAGGVYVIIGHSERRALFGEDDAFVHRKVQAALESGLRPILCVGEQLAEREDGATFRVLRNQVDGALAGLGSPAPDPGDLVLAYEPVWAIGTGRTASTAQAQEAMAFIRERLAELFSWPWAERVRLLYGGSASPNNAEELAGQQDVDGFLVGGAGLDPDKLSTMVDLTSKAAGTRERQERGV